jgi:ATP-dependent DNA helicase DinG
LAVQRRAGLELSADVAALGPFLERVGRIAIVDLETTGLASDSQSEILEFGIALLEPGSSEVLTLQSLVRPSRPLPRAIERLTGLRDADVVDAPPLSGLTSEVFDKLVGRTVIAHNAEFERDFLRRFVHPDLGPARYLDTQDLLALTHPDTTDLRLESFTRRMLGSEERHRALDDALDTLRVLCVVAQGVEAQEPRYTAARRALERFAPDSPWLPLLGDPLVSPELAPRSGFVAIGDTPEAPVPFDEEAIAAALADAARGARHFQGYRVRSEQITLARQFVRTLAEGGRLLIEGGTGVGKSLAYLAAAIPCAIERTAGGVREPVLISTRTKLLQDQLIEKDIAAAARFLGYPQLKALSMKGRANYVCERRLQAVLAEGREPELFPEARLAYALLASCAATRPHGEIGSLPAAFHRRYPVLRDLARRAVASRSEQCSREECARYPSCPFGRRRAALTQAHLVVANHDLLLRWPPDYPAFTIAIADEGHELASVADEAFAVMVGRDAILECIDEIFGRPREKGRREHEALLPSRARRGAEKDALALRRAIHLDLSSLGDALADDASEYGDLELEANADRRYPEAAQLAEGVASRIEQVAALADRLEAATSAEEPDAASPVQKATALLRDQARALRLAFGADREEAVAKFEGLGRSGEGWQLVIRKVSPASDFHRELLDKLEAFAAVSATLFVGEDAFAALGSLELEERARDGLTRVRVGSPFPYEQHMRVAALDLRGDASEFTATVITDLARRLSGRTLGLFTSLRRMNAVADAIMPALREEGLDLLSPRRAGDDPGALVERFVRSRGAGVLLGSRQFWQGLDIPGDALQALVIDKLPFEVPSELSKRREQRIRADGGDPFTRAALGRMLLNLKQMVGRLIRSENDRGLVVIVESRHDKRYFRDLPKALPAGVRVDLVSPDKLPAMLAELGLGTAR